MYNTEKTNGDNSRFEIRSTINCKRSSECTRRIDQFYWRKNDLILRFRGETESVF